MIPYSLKDLITEPIQYSIQPKCDEPILSGKEKRRIRRKNRK